MARRAKQGGTDNVLADLGFPDAEELTAKAILAKKVNDILDEQGLDESAAATLLGLSQARIAAIRLYKLRGVSLDRLMQSLTALGQRVEIVVRPSRAGSRDARIDVAA